MALGGPSILDPETRGRAIGFFVLGWIALLLLYAGVTGRAADLAAALLAPAFLEEA